MLLSHAVSRRLLRLACGFFSMHLLLTACGDDKKDEPKIVTASPNFDSLWTTVFENRCSTCHSPAAGNEQTRGGPDLSTKETFYAALVGKVGRDYPDWTTFTKNRGTCASVSFIKAGDAANSMVVAILDSSVAPCRVYDHVDTGQVPKETVATPGNIAALKQWINTGAAQK
jgi:hypothetical protein